MQALIDWLSQLTAQSLPQIEQYYHPDCRFQDPFNRVEGRDKVRHLFNEMFQLDNARFELLQCIEQDHRLFITWNLHFSIWGKPQCIHGGSLIETNDAGLVTSHLDYWDAAEQVYEKIPLLGSIMRLIKKRFQ